MMWGKSLSARLLRTEANVSETLASPNSRTLLKDKAGMYTEDRQTLGKSTRTSGPKKMMNNARANCIAAALSYQNRHVSSFSALQVRSDEPRWCTTSKNYDDPTEIFDRNKQEHLKKKGKKTINSGEICINMCPSFKKREEWFSQQIKKKKEEWRSKRWAII
jgi:hypothetical protein